MMRHIPCFSIGTHDSVIKAIGSESGGMVRFPQGAETFCRP